MDVRMPDGTIITNVPDGMTQEALMAILNGQKAAPSEKKEPFGKRLDRELSDIPRQLGLTTRAILEGGADITGIVTNPIKAVANKLGANIGMNNDGSALADMIGLPQPSSTTERVVNTMGRMGVGSAGMVGGANRLAGMVLSPITQRVMQTISANPGLQAASAAGSGAAGGYTRETGGSDASQFVASLAGGLAAPGLLYAGQSAVKAIPGMARNAVEAIAPGATMPKQQMALNILSDAGVDYRQIPANVMSQVADDVAKAMKGGGTLSKDALQRLVAYRSVGATPLRGNLTLNPGEITREANLSKIAVNSSDKNLQMLPMRQNQNNAQLIAKVNELGAAGAPDQFEAAKRVISAIGEKDAAARANINSLYTAAKNSDGRSALLDPHHFSNTANNMLEANLSQHSLPPNLRNMMNDFADGTVPLTVDTAEIFKTNLAAAMRDHNLGGDAKVAAGIVRNALEDTPLLGSNGQSAIDAFNAARSANRQWMRKVDQTPALQAVRDIAEPDKFMSQYIIGNGNSASVASVARLKNMVKDSPQALNAIRGNILTHIKEKALNGAPDEFGTFSASGFSKALDSIGERKLKMFFTRDEIRALKDIETVSRAETFQPRGSAVNNSNTAGTAFANVFERLAQVPMLGKIPMAKQIIIDPASNISAGLQAKRALDVPGALVIQPERQRMNPAQFLPVGLLSVQQ